MIFPYLLVLAGQLSASQPLVSNIVVSSGFAGVCTQNGPLAASVLISWTVVNPNPAAYNILVYENGTLLNTLGSDQTSYSKAVTGQVENGSTAPWSSNWTYRVDLVRIVDNVTVASLTAPSAWVKRYGGC